MNIAPGSSKIVTVLPAHILTLGANTVSHYTITAVYHGTHHSTPFFGPANQQITPPHDKAYGVSPGDFDVTIRNEGPGTITIKGF